MRYKVPKQFQSSGSMKPTSEMISRVLIRLCKQPIDYFRDSNNGRRNDLC